MGGNTFAPQIDIEDTNDDHSSGVIVIIIDVVLSGYVGMSGVFGWEGPEDGRPNT